MFELIAYKLIKYYDKNKDKYQVEADSLKITSGGEEIETKKKENSQCKC